MKLDEEVLSRFNDKHLNNFWYGPLEELELFNFWKMFKDMSKGLMFIVTLNQCGRVSMDFTLDEIGNCILAEIIKEESPLGKFDSFIFLLC